MKHFNCWWKAVKNLICYSCIFNVQLHVHLKKWTLKFRLLYLMNYISYFNKICSICCVNTHIQSLKVWLISVYYHGWNTAIFLGDCFLLAHPVHEVTMLLLTTLSCINRNSNNKRCWRICYHFYRHVSSICWVPNSRKSAK